MAGHELPREDLGAFDLGRAARGAADGQPAPRELVGDAQHHRQLGADQGEVGFDRLREIRDLDDVGGVDGNAVGELRDAGVAGSAVQVGDKGALADLPDERVLASAIADDEDLHAPPEGDMRPEPCQP